MNPASVHSPPAPVPPPASPTPHSAAAQKRARSEDDAAAWVAEAVRQYESPLVQYCTRLLRGDVDRARDVVQDAFLKLWSAERSEIEGHLGQWLYRVCRNRALDVRRKEQRMTALQDEQLNIRSDHASGAPREAVSPDVEATQPRTPAVFDMLDSLNESQAEALRLKFQGGLSYKEIAAVMDITSNHVGVIIHNAIKALRERATTPANMRGEA